MHWFRGGILNSTHLLHPLEMIVKMADFSDCVIFIFCINPVITYLWQKVFPPVCFVFWPGIYFICFVISVIKICDLPWWNKCESSNLSSFSSCEWVIGVSYAIIVVSKFPSKSSNCYENHTENYVCTENLKKTAVQKIWLKRTCKWKIYRGN